MTEHLTDVDQLPAPRVVNDMSRFVIVELPAPVTYDRRKQIAERIASALRESPAGPSKLGFSWTWDDNARKWLISCVDMGDGLLAGYDHFAGYYERLLIEEIERLRTALTGISTCSTCEACRGAALRALGEQT